MLENNEHTSSKEVKKHSAIIHCSNTLSLLQRKISNALLYHAYPNLLKQEEHEMTIGYLCQLIYYYGGNYNAIKDALRQLIATVIEWNLTGDKAVADEDWTASAILASVRIKSGKIQYAYSPRLRELLYSPAVYSKINLVIQARFHSNYGLALYENCLRYKDINSTKWFDMDVFRKLMGIPKEKYQRYKDFKKRVLNKAIEEVNTISDIYIQPETIETDRKVIKIRFLLKNREKKKKFVLTKKGDEKCELAAEEPTFEKTRAITTKLHASYAIMTQDALKLIEQYSIDLIEEKMLQIESSTNYLAGKIKNLGGYLIDALKNNYTVAKSSKALILEQEHEKKATREKLQMEQKRLEKSKSEYNEYWESRVGEIIKNLQEDTVSDFKQEFESYLITKKNNFGLERYKKYGLNNKIVTALFHIFLTETHPELFPGVVNFEEFCSNLQKN